MLSSCQPRVYSQKPTALAIMLGRVRSDRFKSYEWEAHNTPHTKPVSTYLVIPSLSATSGPDATVVVTVALCVSDVHANLPRQHARYSVQFFYFKGPSCCTRKLISAPPSIRVRYIFGPIGLILNMVNV